MTPSKVHSTSRNRERLYYCGIRDSSPPGCIETYDAFPDANIFPDIGLVFEHRFAFYFWAQWSLMFEERPLILVSLDSHDDIGAACDQTEVPSRVLECPIGLAMYAWLCLPGNDDGQIVPAIQSNFFSEAFVLRNCCVEDLDSIDIESLSKEYGQKKAELFLKAHCFCNEQELIASLPQNSHIILDIDIDFFFEQNKHQENLNRSQIPRWSDERIRQFFTKQGGLMQKILPRIKGVTIALEPGYCCGIEKSVEVLSVIRECFLEHLDYKG